MEGGQRDAINPLQTPKDKSNFSPFQSGLHVSNPRSVELHVWLQRALSAGVKRCTSTGLPLCSRERDVFGFFLKSFLDL